MTRIQYVSDLHLEFYKDGSPDTLFPELADPTTGADVLVLAGDIGYPEQDITKAFIRWCCAHWPRVVWVYGNHEYYNKAPSYKWFRSTTPALSMSEKEAAGEALAAECPQLTILQNSVLRIAPGLIIAGATCWTDIPKERQEDTKLYMNDFKYIKGDAIEGFPLSLEDWLERHAVSRQFLETVLKRAAAAEDKVVVVTHHLPSFSMILKRYEGHPMNHGFASHMDKLLKDPAVATWICGHSHGSRSVGNCYLNARGYPGELSQKEFQPAAVLEI
jgi:hypothetical protein